MCPFELTSQSQPKPQAEPRPRSQSKRAKKLRLDQLLVERGCFQDEEAALRAVLAREVKVDDVYATSAALKVSTDCDIQIKNRPVFVSRGGVKLQAALERFGLDVKGLNCIDIGCSTGGFSDCLLQAGAGHVTCVDVGYGDLAWKVRNDPRVNVFERTNIRTVQPSVLGGPFDVIVADLSFIGLAQLAPVFASLSKPGSRFVGLIKPQFESQAGETDERGKVVSKEVRKRCVQEVKEALEQVGFRAEGVVESPIHGRKSHNVEYLVLAVFETAC